MAVTKRIRYEVLRRDGFACRYCGAMAPDVKLTVDHVMPVALGGTDDPTNLVTACADCNAGKASVAPDSPIVADVEDDALRWARAMEAAQQLLAADLKAEREIVGGWLETWEKWSDIDYIPADFADSILKFHRAGLSLEVMQENAFKATGVSYVARRNQFRYFCGICHNQIREIQERAKAIVAEGDAKNGA